MTLSEKAGQMNQYNGFWDATGPMPKGDYQTKRYNELKNEGAFMGISYFLPCSVSTMNVRKIKVNQWIADT